MDQVKHSPCRFFFIVVLFTLALTKSDAQSCSGSWVTNNLTTYQCVTGQNIGINNNYPDPAGCPVNPTYTATQTNTFNFDNPMNDFSIDFNAFSSSPGCARLQIKINGVFYHLTASNLTGLPIGANCFGSVDYLTITSDGYLTGSALSAYNSNGQGRLSFTGVNATSVTLSTNDGASSVYTSPCTPAVVPLLLKRFTGKAVDVCKAVLNWETGVETNVKNIELLGSLNGSEFKKIAEVLPKGSDSYYNFETENFDDTYFRLRINDVDGSYQYSQIIYVKTVCVRGGYQLTPNPAHDNIKITNLKTNDQVFVLDMLGKTELTFDTQQSRGELDIRKLATGVYYLRVVHDNRIVANLRMIKY